MASYSLYMRNKSNVSIILLLGQLFQFGVSPFASSKASKNTSKSPANVTFWLLIFSKLDSIVVSSLGTLTCSFFVLLLELFISKKLQS